MPVFGSSCSKVADNSIYSKGTLALFSSKRWKWLDLSKFPKLAGDNRKIKRKQKESRMSSTTRMLWNGVPGGFPQLPTCCHRMKPVLLECGQDLAQGGWVFSWMSYPRFASKLQPSWHTPFSQYSLNKTLEGLPCVGDIYPVKPCLRWLLRRLFPPSPALIPFSSNSATGPSWCGVYFSHQVVRDCLSLFWIPSVASEQSNLWLCVVRTRLLVPGCSAMK